MPIHTREYRGRKQYRWGKQGKWYDDRKGAERQAAAAYASGYKGDDKSAKMKK